MPIVRPTLRRDPKSRMPIGAARAAPQKINWRAAFHMSTSLRAERGHKVHSGMRSLVNCFRLRQSRLAARKQRDAVYNRYSGATMIPRQAYLDNLEIASRLLQSRALNGTTVVECGTWRGGMAAGLIETLGPARHYHFFDSFEGLPPAREIDGISARQWQEDIHSPEYCNNCTASEREFRETVAMADLPADRLHVHRGLFEKTVPESDTGPIGLLRLDGDWYDSTMCCLRALFPRISSGGILVIDDYGTWDGCTRAVHEYLAAQSRPEPIEHFGSGRIPYLCVRA
jgi:O-methyltransferase